MFKYIRQLELHPLTFPEKTTLMEGHPIAPGSSEFYQWDEVRPEGHTRPISSQHVTYIIAWTLIPGYVRTRPCGFCYSIYDEQMPLIPSSCSTTYSHNII